MSNIIQLEWPEKSIASITLQDAQTKNALSLEFLKTFKTTFEQIEQNADAKIVILKGLSSIFSSGLSSDLLLQIVEENNSIQHPSYADILLNCELPVLAVMEGDAYGDGLTLGAFADILILSEEAKYTCNFLKYGFIPPNGSTFIIPYKFGPILGNELLYTSKIYSGKDLKSRSSPVLILKKPELLNELNIMTKELIDKPKVSLKLLKKNLCARIKENVALYIKNEKELQSALIKENKDTIKASIHDQAL